MLQKFFPIYVFVFALFIRLGFLTSIYQGNDRIHYFEDVGIAINLVEGEGYVLNVSMMQRNVPSRPTAWKPPVYPIFVALVFFAFGVKNFFALFTLHALLSAFTCTLLYLSISKFSHQKAVIASAAFAMYPPLTYHSVAVAESTTLTLFLISLFCYGLVNLARTFGQKRWIRVAMISGFLAMTEPVTVPFIFLALCYVAYLTLDGLKRISSEMAIAVFVFAATIAPWTLRNYLTFNEFVFIKSNFGSTLKDSMYRSGIRLPRETHSRLVKDIQGRDELSEDKAVTKALVSWIRENPLAYLRLLPKNFMNFWWEIDRYKNGESTRYVFGRKVPYIVLLMFGIPAMLWQLVQLCRNGELRNSTSMYHNIMLILIFTYTAIYTFIGSMNLRYHFPVELGMFIFCAETSVYIFNKLRLPSNNVLTCMKTGL